MGAPRGSRAATTLRLSLRLLESARAAGVKRFVFSSSSSLYGESEALPKVETMLPRLADYRVERGSLVRAASEFQVGYTSMTIEFDPAG